MWGQPPSAVRRAKLGHGHRWIQTSRSIRPPNSSREAAKECSPRRQSWGGQVQQHSQAPKGRKKPPHETCPSCKTLAPRRSCAIFTVPSDIQFRTLWARTYFKIRQTPQSTPFPRDLLRHLAPNPVTGLWTACTRLKIHVLTNAYFSLTGEIEGVQQDRSLTAS